MPYQYMVPMVTGKEECTPFIIYVCGLCGMDHVISESCYKETIYKVSIGK